MVMFWADAKKAFHVPTQCGCYEAEPREKLQFVNSR